MIKTAILVPIPHLPKFFDQSFPFSTPKFLASRLAKSAILENGRPHTFAITSGQTCGGFPRGISPFGPRLAVFMILSRAS